MGKYDRDIQDVYAVKQLGDAIGYGHLMAIAHELWARHLEDRGLPRRGAHCVVGYQMVREQYQAEALNDRIYTIVVDKALEADRKTEPKPICESCSKNPCKKKKMINDIGHWVSECTEFDRKTDPQTCDTCKWGEWYRKGYDITMMSDECGGCCSWNNKWTPKDEPQKKGE